MRLERVKGNPHHQLGMRLLTIKFVCYQILRLVQVSFGLALQCVAMAPPKVFGQMKHRRRSELIGELGRSGTDTSNDAHWRNR